jgi:hypothetical protein
MHSTQRLPKPKTINGVSINKMIMQIRDRLVFQGKFG